MDLAVADDKPMRRCERCETPFSVPRQAPHKRFCSERCQRAAERERYRRRHTEIARCKRCGGRFTRAATSKRTKVYCTLGCQWAKRSSDYRNRDDIRAQLAAARDRGEVGGKSSKERKT